MKWTISFAAGIILLIALSVFADRTESGSVSTVRATGPEIRAKQAGTVNTVSYRVSGTVNGHDGSCLVFRLDLLRIRITENALNMVLDIYLYDTLMSKDRIVTKRVAIKL